MSKCKVIDFPIKEIEQRVCGVDLDRTHNLLLALPNLEMLDPIMLYLQELCIIDEWDLVTDVNSFIIGKSHMIDIVNEMGNTQELYDIIEHTRSYDLISEEMINKPSARKFLSQRDKNDTMVLFPIGIKRHIQFNCMREIFEQYTSEIVVSIDKNAIDEDDIYRFIQFDCATGKEKWFMLDYLSNCHLLKFMHWYRRFNKKIIKPIPDDYYMINVKVTLCSDWYGEITKKI